MADGNNTNPPSPVLPAGDVPRTSTAATITPRQQSEAITVPDLTETPAERVARLARKEAGTSNEADATAERLEAERDEAQRKKDAFVDYYSNWSFATRASGSLVNEHTIMATHSDIARDNPRLPFYVNDTTVNLMDAPTAVIDLCNLLNRSEDAYSHEAASMGRVTEREYLLLPAGLPIPHVPINEVGTPEAVKRFDTTWLMAVYALNKSLCNDTANGNDIKFGLARMQAVKLGWYDGLQPQVKMVTVPANLLKIMTDDKATISSLESSYGCSMDGAIGLRVYVPYQGTSFHHWTASRV
ncbi:unnamed protein product [Microthlaspi erraticum]|uniref:Uncharacterized protein n=1 Tax=Microthlaspi erraticum TaxID=1685480 RepID=A0A6D2K8X9_9BRAS|nr:unnamed protein product [Microthlaspi erraticum]CAA7055800.1 unnamed protein product [Microthlaspi erraticum]